MERLKWKMGQGKDIIFCYNNNNEELGYLQYQAIGRHMHWCWYQYSTIYMSPGCLQEVRNKQKELLNMIKQK